MNIKSILYLDKPGKAGCPACLAAAAARAVELKLEHAVVASSSGRTALDLAAALKKAGSKARVIAVSYAANYAAKWVRLDPRIKARAGKLGVTFMTAGHAMSGINTAIQEEFGGWTPNKIVAGAYYTIGHGFKVALEVSVMAADQGLVPTNKEILALGGSGKGADTALVLTPACSSEFFGLHVHEIACMPRIAKS
ncbi:MAG: hypothetical protein ABII00_18280 [Elusimicrobiota bacterium]